VASAITASRQLPVQRWPLTPVPALPGFSFIARMYIDASRTGSASGTSMLLSLLESREYVTE
jgi:hypothetical protein